MFKLKLFIILMVSASSSIAFGQVAKSAEDIAPLLIGEKVPAAEITALDGSTTTLTEVVDGKKTILLFYRGGWCPYCNAHLAAVGETEKNILDLGYQIIGIAPDSPKELQHTVDKNELHYTLYSDADVKLIRAMGLAFEVPENKRGRLNRYSGGKNPGVLPVPSLFVLDETGTIVFEYISPNYKERIRPELLLAVLGAL